MYQGIDCSNNNGTINWGAAERAGIDFAFAKATEGLRFVDRYYQQNREGARAHGIQFGAYCFARPGQGNPVGQARWFAQVAHVQPGDLLPCVDFEVTDGKSSTYLAWFGRTLLVELERLIGAAPLLYTFPAFNRAAVAAIPKRYRLWIADPNPVPHPRLPGGYQSYAIWQRSWAHPIGGKRVDYDEAANLRSVTYKPGPPPPAHRLRDPS